MSHDTLFVLMTFAAAVSLAVILAWWFHVYQDWTSPVTAAAHTVTWQFAVATAVTVAYCLICAQLVGKELDRRAVYSDGVVTDALILDREKVKTSKQRKQYVVHYQFADAHGVNFVSSKVVSRKKYKKSKAGKQTKVRYDPQNPDRSLIELKRQLSIDRMFGVGLGTSFILAGALYYLIWSRRFRRWSRASGVVTRATQVGDNSSYTFDFQVGEHTYSVRASTNGGSVGDQVLVFYNPENPQKADVHSAIHYYLFAMLMPVVGCLCAWVMFQMTGP